jgi:hypothetical protein
MDLDASRFKLEWAEVNPKATAVRYPDCPINQICFYIMIGSEGVTKKCQYLTGEGYAGKCNYKESVQGV